MNNLNRDSNDAITRHHWEIQLLQGAFLSFAGSLIIYLASGSEDLKIEMLLATIAGFLQFLEHILLTMVTRHNRRWLVAIDIFVFLLFGFCVIPIITLVFTL